MTKEDFRNKDMELAHQIAEYEASTCEMDVQIALNRKEIARLKYEREKLNAMRHFIEDDLPQRNLQGEIIK